VPRGNGVSGMLLKNGDFVACVYRGLADDFAGARAHAIAAKVIKSARKKFSRFTLKIFDREISAWDYFCYSQHIGAQAGADKFISDFIRVSLIKRLEAVPPVELNLLAIATVRFEEIDETTELNMGKVFQHVHEEILRIAAEHGQTIVSGGLSVTSGLQPLLTAGSNSSRNGASPA
jgi:hypothetical protein